MHKIRIDYMDKKNKVVTSIIILSESEESAYTKLYEIRDLLDKEETSYIVFTKKGFFSTYKRMFTINDLKIK